LDKIEKEKVEKEYNLKETQENSTTVAQPSKAIDLKKDEEQVDKIGVPIVNESKNKEEPPTNQLGEGKWKQVMTTVSRTLTRTKNTPLRLTVSRIKVHLVGKN
jgi:hypothetical protein